MAQKEDTQKMDETASCRAGTGWAPVVGPPVSSSTSYSSGISYVMQSQAHTPAAQTASCQFLTQLPMWMTASLLTLGAAPMLWAKYKNTHFFLREGLCSPSWPLKLNFPISASNVLGLQT